MVDLIPEVGCWGEGIERDHCSVDAAPGGCVWPWCRDGFSKPGGGVMLIELFNIL